MREINPALQAHLDGGATCLCRCWQVTRRDGVVFGFTDHDHNIVFEGVTFKAGTGLDAAAIQQSTGLSVDNTQAVGALSDFSVSEADILAGFYDGAEVLVYVVNWMDASQRALQFRGSLGEIKRGGGAFEAELRGLSEPLNQPQGRAYHKSCSAVLGDADCKFDLSAAGYVADLAVESFEDSRVFLFSGATGFDEGWFEDGMLRVQSGAAAGELAIVKLDRFRDGLRRVELWQELRRNIATGDTVRLTAGCNKRPETCRLKFQNFLNFRGFPYIPGDDWAISVPSGRGVNDGESRY